MRYKRLSMAIVSVLIVCLFGLPSMAKQKRDMGGWEADSKYNKLYDAAELDSFKAVVVRVKKIKPMSGMSPGVALEIREGKGDDGELILVHLCPTWFSGPKDIGIKKGDKIKVKGVWAEIENEEVFLASKIKRGQYFELKLRLTKNGKPFWTMTPEELAKERASSKASLKK